MSSSSVDELTSGLCSICLNTVVDDNSRGKAELVCGHLFHLDCIGSEFNYRSEMKCPNCRVVENGEWLMPDDDDFEDEDDHSGNVRRLELHIYSHSARGNSSSSRDRDETVNEEPRLVSPTVHYHHNTVVLPPSYGNYPSTDYYYGATAAPPQAQAQASLSTQSRSTNDHFVLHERPSLEELTRLYRRTRYHNSSQNYSTMDTAASMRQRREQNAFDHHVPRNESFSTHDNPSLELTLTTNPSEAQSQEEPEQRREMTPEGQSAHENDENFWFRLRD